MTLIRPAQPSDAQFHWDHNKRITQESGRDGDVIFSPNENWEMPQADFLKSYNDKFGKSVSDLGWQRTWVLAEPGGIFGDLTLIHGPPLKSCLHRANLMMGIERSHRSRGLGSRLMGEAISWAQAQPTLEWLQLYVFDGNEPAKKLYHKFGFQEIGTVPDMFRVHGVVVADITMVLKLR